MKGFALLALLAGCYAPPDVARATALVWNVYQMPPAAPPPVEILTRPTCYDVYGNSGLDVAGACDTGFTDDAGCHVLVESTLAASAFAHELHHWAIYMRRGGGRASMDPDHLDPTWATEVPVAVAALDAAGL